jgi:hypothetical protein
MAKARKDQLSFDDTIYTKPADDIAVKLVGDASAKPRVRGKAKTPLPESLQPFLPGLSRRGRPRSKNPIPATVRATESRKRRIEAGIKRIEILLAPEVAADLDLLSGHFRVSRVEIISRLVAKAAKRIRLSETLSAAPSGRRSTS